MAPETKKAPKLVNTKKAQEDAKAQAEQALIDARAEATRYRLAFNELHTLKELHTMVGEAREKGIIPDGETPPEIQPAGSSLGKKKEAPKVDQVEDIEISTEAELEEHQESGKLVGFSNWKAVDKDGNITDIPSKDDSGAYGYVAGKSKAIVRVALSLVLFAIMACGTAFAALDGTEEGVLGNERWKTTSSGDLVPVSDSTYAIGAVGAEVEDLYVDEIALTTDLTFRNTLIGTGRVNASLTLASSSTVIAGSNVPYAVIRKNIGAGTGGLDTVDGGTRLANGKPGAFLSIIIASCGSGSYWDVTPVTKTGFSSIRFTAKGQTAQLLYVDDTIGWVISGIGTTASAASPTVTPTAFGSGLEPLV